MENILTLSKTLSLLCTRLINEGITIKTEKWQGIKLEHELVELLFVSINERIPQTIEQLQLEVKPNLPWADDHFKERVGGLPLNPGKTYMNWPFYKRDKEMRTENGKFSHSYMERIWPKKSRPGDNYHGSYWGIRYEYGDLNNLVDLLYREPGTRQAYLPIWFPEDTGAVHGGRVPCTLGYHFIIRNSELHIIYYIRSCDFVRHLKDDIYLAIRKLYWILDELRLKNSFWNKVMPGNFIMHITSLHCFKSDLYSLKRGKY